MLKDQQDAYGHEVWNYYKGKYSFEIVEREGGYFELSSGPEIYFTEKQNKIGN